MKLPPRSKPGPFNAETQRRRDAENCKFLPSPFPLPPNPRECSEQTPAAKQRTPAAHGVARSRVLNSRPMAASNHHTNEDRLPSHWAANAALGAEHARPRGWTKNIYAVAEALFTTEEGPPPDERLCWLCAEVRDFVARIGWRARFLYRLSLFILIWVAPIIVLRPIPGRWGSLERRIRLFNRIEHSVLGAPALAVKAILCINYYEHPDSAREIGFDGTCLLEHQEAGS